MANSKMVGSPRTEGDNGDRGRGTGNAGHPGARVAGMILDGATARTRKRMSIRSDLGGYMAGFLFSPQGDLASRASGDESVGVDIPAASEGFEFARPDRGIRHAASLARMVESEIIPRLMLAHRAFQAAEAPTTDTRSPPADERSPLGDKTTEAFARMVVSKEPDSLIAFVGTLLRDGVSMESVYLDLLVPAARRLGEYWDEDSVSFADVTIGLGRLQQVVRALGWKSPAIAKPTVCRPRPCSRPHLASSTPLVCSSSKNHFADPAGAHGSRPPGRAPI